MKLIKYRDAGMHTYTYFYVSEQDERTLSPFFDSEKDAEEWLFEQEKIFMKRKTEQGDCV